MAKNQSASMTPDTGQTPRKQGAWQMPKPAKNGALAWATMLLIWELFARLMELNPGILPSPSRILGEIWLEADRLKIHAGITAYEVLTGLFIAILLAVPLSILAQTLPLTKRLLGPPFRFLNRPPLVLLVPFFFIWFGYGIRPKVFMSLLLCFISIACAALSSLPELPPEFDDFLRTTGSGRCRILFKILLPASLQPLFAGIRSGATLSLLGTVIGEYVEAEKGLGSVIVAATSRMDTPLLCAALAILALLALVIHLCIGLMERLLIPWRFEQPAD